MSVTYIPEKTKFMLWGRAAGRCQYRGCPTRLSYDGVTKFEFNTAYVAHIVADRPDGPRGDRILSDQLKRDIRNLMLMCDVHHRLIDKEQVDEHPVELLQEMKREHEARIELVTGIGVDRASEVLLYGANVGTHTSPVNFDAATQAMLPTRYPSSRHGIVLGMQNSSFTERDELFWSAEEQNLRAKFLEHVRPGLQLGRLHHLSVFAMAPQPLLVLLGHLLSDIPAADVFQLHREPPGWDWREDSESQEFRVNEPEEIVGEPALVIGLSATVDRQRISSVLGDDATIWEVSVREPHNDLIQSQEQLREFRGVMRRLMDKIKARHGEGGLLHVFPVMPVSTAVEFGRVHMPKADLPLRIYDQPSPADGFLPAIDLNVEVTV